MPISTGRILTLTIQAFNFVPDVSSAKGAADDMVRLLDSKPEIDADARDGVSLDQDQISGHLELRDVHFRYRAFGFSIVLIE